MGSGRQTGGFDGWRGSSPGGSGGGGGGVTQIVAGTGIGVSPPGGTGVVTVSNTGVTSLIAGAGVTIDHPTGAVTIGLDATLASLYTFGLGDNPTTDNTLVGSAFNTFFKPDGSIDNTQTAAGNYNEVLRQLTSTQGLNRVPLALVTKYSGGLNTSGGVGIDGFLENNAGAQNNFWQFQAQLNLPVVADWYNPVLVSGAQFTFVRHLMNASASGSTIQWYHNSDGVTWQQCLLPSSGGPYTLAAFNTTMNSRDGGGSTPQIGSMLGWRVSAQATDPGIATATIGEIYAELTAQNFGSAQAAGKWHMFVSTLANGRNDAFTVGPGLVTVKDYAATNVAAAQFENGNNSPVSDADTGTIRYHKDETSYLNRLQASNNTDIYSPIFLFSDYAPVANGAVAVSLGSTGPTGSSATPTRWAKIFDPSTGGMFLVPSYDNGMSF